MTGNSSRRIGIEQDADGAASGSTRLTPVADDERCDVLVCDEAVPIIFVPGIMGSNLRNSKTGESVWRANSLLGLAWQWAFRSSATRQRKLNPETTEVDDDGAFYGESATVMDKETAKIRGWGSTAKYGYGKYIPWLDTAINADDASPWQSMENQENAAEKWSPEKPFQKLTKAESEKGWALFCPVHCVGYNWLQTNADSGDYLSEKVAEIIAFWTSGNEEKGTSYRCKKVVLVTHSMGGLVSRAMTHPKMGNSTEHILGINHGVMPALGAPAAYHHIRTGYDFPTGLVLGRNAAQVTAILANAPGGLELLPTHSYPQGWLRAMSNTGEEIMALRGGDPYVEIYAEDSKWWRLVDKALIDPADLYGKAEIPVDPWSGAYRNNLKLARNFHTTMEDWYFNPTYSHYGADPAFKTYQKLSWQAKDQLQLSEFELVQAGVLGDNSDPVTLNVPGAPRFYIPKAIEPGDGTVSEWSGARPHTSGNASVKQSFKLKGLDHGTSYNVSDTAQQSTLYSIGKLLGKYE